MNSCSNENYEIGTVGRKISLKEEKKQTISSNRDALLNFQDFQVLNFNFDLNTHLN